MAAKKEQIFGTVTGKSKGFNIRMQVKNKKHNGKFGIYAGKKLVQEVNSTSEALKIISTDEFTNNWKRNKSTKNNL